LLVFVFGEADHETLEVCFEKIGRPAMSSNAVGFGRKKRLDIIDGGCAYILEKLVRVMVDKKERRRGRGACIL
jgi:hypothetical protein